MSSLALAAAIALLSFSTAYAAPRLAGATDPPEASARAVSREVWARASIAPLETAPQLDGWAPKPGWRVVQDHPAHPDFLEIGIIGERYVDPNAFPPPPRGVSRADPRNRARGSFNAAEMPRLVLRCENGTTEAWVLRPPRVPPRSRPAPGAEARSAGSGAAGELGTLVLAFGPDERIDIDLSQGYRRVEPIHLPEPYDNIGRMRRAEILYYFEIERGRVVTFSYGGRSLGALPDAVFPLGGLDDLLRARRDPCGWRASEGTSDQ